MSEVLAAVEEVLKLAMLNPCDLREGYVYDIFYTYPKSSYTYLGQQVILTLVDNRIWNDTASFLIWNITVGTIDMSRLHLFLPTLSKQQILKAFRGTKFYAETVKEALDHLYSGQTVKI